MDMETNDVNTFHKCVVCDAIFQQLDNLEKHNKIHVKEEKTDNIDEYCHVHFEKEKTDVDENCHVKEEKTDNGDDFCVKEEKTDDIENVFQCKLCGEEFKSDTDLEKHCKIHVEEELKVYNDSNVGLQSADGPGVSKNHKCDFCSKSYTYKSGLQRHIRVHTGELSATNYSDIDLQSADSHAIVNHYKCDKCFKSFSCWRNLQTHIKGHIEDQLLSTIGLNEHYDLGSITELPIARITNRLVQCIVNKFPNTREHLSIIRALHEDCITFTDKYIQTRLVRLKTTARKLRKNVNKSDKFSKLYDDFLESPFFPMTIDETSSADTNTTNSVDVETQTSVDETLTNLSKKNKYLLNKVSRDKVTIFRLKNQLRKITKALIQAKANNKKALAIKKNGFSRTLVGKK